MRLQRNYYEVLGLPRTASSSEIKRRYRELARKFHPDVVQDKTFGQRAFVQINEAYQTLKDPVKRREYDRTLPVEGAPTASATSSTASAAQTPPSRPEPQRHGTSAGHATTSKFIRDAEFAFIKGKLGEAASFCQQAIREGKSTVRAHSILGDIYRLQGKLGLAINEYTIVTQLDPTNHEVAAKLAALERQGRAKGAETKKKHKVHLSEARLNTRSLLLYAGGWSVAFLLLLLLTVFPGQPADSFKHYLPVINTWSWNLMWTLILDSVLVGCLMSLTGLIEHPDEELILESSANAYLPTGLLLLVFSGFFFWFAAGLYLLISLLQDGTSSSVMRVFAATIAMIILSALLYAPGWRQVLQFSGNLVFIGMVVGWYIGAMARPLAKE